MKKRHRVLNILLNVFIVIMIVVSVGLIYRNVNYDGVYIDGTSMEPTLHNMEYGYKNKTKSAKNKVLSQRFKIVIFTVQEPSTNETKTLVKRVIGLPGETIHIDQTTGDLYVNSQLIEQPFITTENRANTCHNSLGIACDKDYVVPEKSLYVLGDNRLVSLDSERRYGAIESESLLGVLRVIYKKDCTSFKQSACSLTNPRWY